MGAETGRAWKVREGDNDDDDDDEDGDDEDDGDSDGDDDDDEDDARYQEHAEKIARSTTATLGPGIVHSEL